MSDPTKNVPIRIPIETDDEDVASASPTDEDDVIEIDGDAVDLAEDLSQFDPEIEAPSAVDAEVAEADAPAPAGRGTGDLGSRGTGDLGSETPKAPEISREAVFEMMQELRQKTEQVARLGDEKNDLMDRLLRKQAEFENFRKRGEREMQDAYVRARADLLGDILPIIDNFDLALQHAENASAEVIHEGVQLIYKQMMDTLGRLGLEAIEAAGQPFDPEMHEAVATEQSEEVPDHTVVGVLQRGFKLGDRMLRPARVKVAVQP
jgi:molecular chaperone GrpE